jgi:5'-nucleotidase (lipoprotein e(P4) family)
MTDNSNNTSRSFEAESKLNIIKVDRLEKITILAYSETHNLSTGDNLMFQSRSIVGTALICAALATPSFADDAKPLPDQMILPTAWVQSSAEYRALTISIYNMSKIILDMHLAKPSAKPKAIILDLDETLLDNAPFQAMTVAEQTGYPDGWFDWIDAAQAEATPGGLDFLNYADSKGVQIFYLSNRKNKGEREGPGLENTLKNIVALHFPQAEASHVYLRTGSSSKEERRQAIMADHDVVMMFGDNLNDLSDDFKGGSVAERKAAVAAHVDEFGVSWIVLPNPMYGEWEGAMYSYNWGAPQSEKSDMRKAALKYWVR